MSAALSILPQKQFSPENPLFPISTLLAGFML